MKSVNLCNNKRFFKGERSGMTSHRTHTPLIFHNVPTFANKLKTYALIKLRASFSFFITIASKSPRRPRRPRPRSRIPA